MPGLTEKGQVRRTRRKAPNLQLIGLRVNAGLSRETLALRAGIGRETVRIAETGFTPTPRVQFAIAKALGMHPLDLWPIESQRRPS